VAAARLAESDPAQASHHRIEAQAARTALAAATGAPS
jgi:hypothetical protein